MYECTHTIILVASIDIARCAHNRRVIFAAGDERERLPLAYLQYRDARRASVGGFAAGTRRSRRIPRIPA